VPPTTQITRTQIIVKEIKQYQKQWLQHTQTEYQNTRYDINQKDEGT